VHWTYSAFDPDSDLEQGDVLTPTPELKQVLEKVHKHFCHDKYLAFTIATQSCDLVRRVKGAKARYISIAVVRSLKEVLPRLLAQVIDTVAPGVFKTSGKQEAKRFLNRVLDQNEQALGLFYLHADVDLELGEPCVALLRVNMALRDDHYDVLMRARRGRLNPEFRAKFGWLLGNLYSRAASPDWADAEGGKQKKDALVEQFSNEQIAGKGPIWVDDEVLAAAKLAGVKFEEHEPAQLIQEVERHRPKPRIELVVDAVMEEAIKVMRPNDDQQRALRNRLLNSGMLRKLSR
jgi:hypothetical protein